MELNFEAAAASVAGTRTGFLKLNGPLRGLGNVTTRVVNGNATGTRVGVFQLNGANTAWTGGLTLGNATANSLNQHVVRIGNTAATSSANAVTIRENGTLQLGGLAATVGNPTVAGTAGAAGTEGVENVGYLLGTLTITQNTDANWDVLFRDGTPTSTHYEDEAGSTPGVLNLVKAGGGIATINLET